MEEHPPFSGQIHTCFDGYSDHTCSQNILSMPCYIEDSLVQAHTLQRIVHPHALQAGGPFFAAAAVLSSGQHGLSFIFVIGTQQSHLHQRQCPPRDSSGSASALAEMSSQASPRSLLGDHLRLHRRPGLSASPSSNSCSKRLSCPSLATRVMGGHTPNPNFLRKTAKKTFLVFIPMAKDCTAARVFGPWD